MLKIWKGTAKSTHSSWTASIQPTWFRAHSTKGQKLQYEVERNSRHSTRVSPAVSIEIPFNHLQTSRVRQSATTKICRETRPRRQSNMQDEALPEVNSVWEGRQQSRTALRRLMSRSKPLLLISVKVWVLHSSNSGKKLLLIMLKTNRLHPCQSWLLFPLGSTQKENESNPSSFQVCFRTRTSYLEWLFYRRSKKLWASDTP